MDTRGRPPRAREPLAAAPGGETEHPREVSAPGPRPLPTDASAAVDDSSVDALLAELTREFPRFRLREKRGDRLSRLLDLALRAVTLGRQRRYLTEYHTVLGSTLYLPDSWQRASARSRVILLRHERVHLRQRRRYGALGLAFLYLIPWFPVGLAYFRARLEWEAYRETLRATAELGGLAAAQAPELRAELVARFTGPDYAWMWPFPRTVNRWLDAALAELSEGRDAC